MTSPNEITLRRVLVGHRAAVNVVDFDEKYIVSASGDRTIKGNLYKRRRCYRTPIKLFSSLSSLEYIDL